MITDSSVYDCVTSEGVELPGEIFFERKKERKKAFDLLNPLCGTISNHPNLRFLHHCGALGPDFSRVQKFCEKKEERPLFWVSTGLLQKHSA